jgi:histidinol-phosphate aminotransferase
MFRESFKHLAGINRHRVAEPEDVAMRLQRMERPEAWPTSLLDHIYSTIPIDLLQRYPDPLPFYHKLATFLDVPVNSIVLTSGVDEAIRSILTLCCEPGDKIVVTAPGYAMYDVYAKIFGVHIHPIHFDAEHFMSPDEVIARIPHDVKVVFLANPSQPVENCFDLEQLRLIAAHCANRGILLCVDEAYHFFGAPSSLPMVKETANLLVMRSFSKAFGAASLRLGYIVGQEDVLAPFRGFRLAHEANALSLHAGTAMLDCFESHIKPGIESVCEGREWLREKCNTVGLNAWGSVANFVLIALDSETKMKESLRLLNERGIYVKGGFPPPLYRHILVTCGSPALMEDFFSTFYKTL